MSQHTCYKTLCLYLDDVIQTKHQGKDDRKLCTLTNRRMCNYWKDSDYDSQTDDDEDVGVGASVGGSGNTFSRNKKGRGVCKSIRTEKESIDVKEKCLSVQPKSDV